MNLSKYPLEKVFFFLAGIIPGFVALLIFQLAAPGTFGWFFTLGFLGYKTKLGLILLSAFIIGNSLTRCVLRSDWSSTVRPVRAALVLSPSSFVGFNTSGEKFQAL